ncbi:hypothetical protein FHS83_003786 [Rhizomicrobium palustre]|uniref:Uncharacterized protein n=1 Tax=Rhizomicrobium palustre TaxID=189966 RepID=A0A846N3B3_9PROT|nr:DUF6600 domain-containing protein [Rhizomicrobium palustre]NIK90468.1 hypothetical protein [Rhizomicrobium palustre]
MRNLSKVRFLVSTLALLPAATLPFISPAKAQFAASISFDSFHDELSHYGSWLYSDRWGMVWQPADMPDDFRPYYTSGHWVFTEDYGWYWTSNYPWGDIAFHYGRWVADPDDGWLWVPGYTWSPGWVVWRQNPTYVGWMPMPPDPYFLDRHSGSSFEFSYSSGVEHISFGWSDATFGYRRWYGPDYDDRRFAANWVFLSPGHMADHDYRPVIVNDPVRVTTIIHQTQNITNYTVVNNYVVNKSVDVHVVERGGGRPVEVMRARDVIRRPALIASLDAGRQARMAAREMAPIGNGIAHSAPPPPPRVVERLSAEPAMFHGRPPAHLFTRANIVTPAAQAKFQGAPEQGHPEQGHPPPNHPPADFRPPDRRPQDVQQPEHRPEAMQDRHQPDAMRGEPPRDREMTPPQRDRNRFSPPERQHPIDTPMVRTPPPTRDDMMRPPHERPAARPEGQMEHHREGPPPQNHVAPHPSPKPEAHRPPPERPREERDREERGKDKEHRPE